MNKSIQLALSAMLFYGLLDIVYKRTATRGIQAYQFMALQTCFFLPGILLYSYFSQSLTIGIPFLWGMSAGVFSLIGLIHFSNSLTSGAVSIVVPVFRLSFIVTSLLAVIFLGEHLSLLKIGSFVLSMVAIWLLLGGGAVDTRITKKALGEVLIATAMMGCVSFIYKLGTLAGGSPATVITGQASLFFPLAIGLAIYRDKGFKLPVHGYKYGAAAGVLLLGALTFLIAGLELGPASTLVPIAQMSFIITACFGIVFLKEKLNIRKTVGFSCAILALTGLALS